MHLKHVILDGFKSYRDRTDIGPFDPHFNAITGLNGSGKSNILDAICFVMGLSSMHVVRAHNLGELIYKGSSGGANKASASLVFDNNDKRPGKCPVGFEKHNEIIVSRTIETSGQCKYYLNSVTSTKKAITDMFESIQLSVSNPNFMIMQGKITKVINMTPKQILSMIEETVGGNVYQQKRDKTEQEIQNKDRCINMVDTTIRQDIYPKWRRQRNAMEKLQEFQTMEYRTARALKSYAIKRYQYVEDKKEEAEVDLQRALAKEAKNDTDINRFKKEIEENKRRQKQMKQENQDKFKGHIEGAEKAMNEEKHSFLQVEAKVKSADEDVKDAEKKLADAQKEKRQKEKEMEDYKKKSSKSVDEFENVKAKIANAEEELKKAREMEHALQMGNIMDEDGNAFDAREELNRVNDEINKIQPDYEVAHKEFEDDRRNLAKMESDLKKTPTNEQVERDYNTKFQKLERLKADAQRRNINPDDIPSEILKNLNNSQGKLRQLMTEKDRNCPPHLVLRYERRNAVDASKIHGCVYELIKFNDVEVWGGALEVLLGGVLGHIVVEDKETGIALLNAGLSRRTHIHPLSVFQTRNTRRVSQQELDRALGPGKARPAIDLVEYHPRYKDIVQHFVGGKVVCDTLETAKKCAFQLHYWAVSQLGDVADPDGVMQGGSRKDLGRLIQTCQRLREISDETKELERSIADLQRRLQGAKANEDFMKQLELAQRDLHNAEETRKLTSYSILKREIEELKAKLAQETEKLKVQKQELDKLEKEKRTWSTKVNQIDSLREKNKKEVTNRLTKWEKELANAKKQYESKQKQFEGVDIDIKSKEALITDAQKEIDAVLAEIEECKKKAEQVNQEYEKAKAKFKKLEDKFNAIVAESNEWNEEYNSMEEENKKLNDEIHKIEVTRIKSGNQKEKLEGIVKHYENETQKLKEEHPNLKFVMEEMDEEDRDRPLNELKVEAEKLKKKHDELSERLDVRAAEEYESTKQVLETAQNRLYMLEDNKEQVVTTMTKLDDQKIRIVQTAYDKINEEFNKMMGTLLPDSAARLVPIKEDDLSEGLNINVRLGGIWKESLSELSGGQKSLVALALVLSLCMYNPAPLYILDEIDAALDLNHTQNIGVLIRRKFVDTQFICVSLKDGMYSNCNILFQVQFQNGRSEVKRCVRQSSKTARRDENETLSAKHLKRIHGSKPTTY